MLVLPPRPGVEQIASWTGERRGCEEASKWIEEFFDLGRDPGRGLKEEGERRLPGQSGGRGIESEQREGKTGQNLGVRGEGLKP